MRYFLFSCSFVLIFSGSTVNLMLSTDQAWHDHIFIWSGFILLGSIAVLAFFHTNKKTIEQYMKTPNNTLLLKVLLGKNKKQE